ncbi:MAG: aminopeptidase P family N-terminal domain-containing protein, partial [Solirubrobacteraceae bacterium]
MSTSARADRVVAQLAERELDGVLVTDIVDVRYLTGFTGTNAACLVTAEERLFMTDFRYIEQAEAQVREFERLPAGRDLTGDLAERLRGRVGFDDARMSVCAHAKLGEKIGEGVELVPAGGLVGGLREVKDADELRRIAAATELATAALERVLERGLAGYTEHAVAGGAERGRVGAGA